MEARCVASSAGHQAWDSLAVIVMRLRARIGAGCSPPQPAPILLVRQLNLEPATTALLLSDGSHTESRPGDGVQGPRNLACRGRCSSHSPPGLVVLSLVCE